MSLSVSPEPRTPLLVPPPATERFLEQFMERVDLNTRAYFAWVYVTRWLGFRLDVVVAIVLAASCFFSVAVNEYSDSIGECADAAGNVARGD